MSPGHYSPVNNVPPAPPTLERAHAAKDGNIFLFMVSCDDVYEFLTFHRYPTGFSKNRKRVLRRKSQHHFHVKRGLLFYSTKRRVDGNSGVAKGGPGRARAGTCPAKAPCSSRSCHAILREGRASAGLIVQAGARPIPTR